MQDFQEDEKKNHDRIMLVEDDTTITHVLKRQLERWGYEVFDTVDFEHVMEAFAGWKPDLVLMDLTLPFFNGYYWCSEIRKVSDVPIIVISSAGDDMNLVMAINMGADDFLAKPFGMEVVVAKIQAVLRRSYAFVSEKALCCVGNVTLDLTEAVLHYKEKELKLSGNEFGILKILMKNPKRPVSREELMRSLWESEHFIDDNTLTVNVTRLRKKLEEIGLCEFIKTRKGIGYQIREEQVRMKKAMAALILFLIETLLFYLYEMPLEAWAYSSVFILLIFGGWIILDEVQQRKKYKQLKNIQKEAEVYLETEHFGKPENAVEKEYQNLAEMLGRQWENARQEARCQISEANRYYIRWSHQIKTPIAALRLLLEEEEPDRAAMEGEIYRIEQYVEFALQYQRLEGGHKDLVFAHYSLESIVKKALKKTGVLFRRTKLALELGNLQTDVLTDEKWLVFVLEQVLTNAVKYTRKGKISIYLDPKKEKTLVVEDTGMGIRPEDLRVSLNGDIPGTTEGSRTVPTGIGLALCRQTMEMLGHRISAKSEPGKGTCIYLDLAVDPVRDY